MSATFNKYQFLRDLKASIITEIENGNIANEDDLRDYVNHDIDNECIYYADCFAIAMELNATDFTAFDMEINNISQLAYCALDEYVNEELDLNELIEIMEEKDRQDFENATN